MTTETVLSLRDIEELAYAALNEHGLLDKGWRFGWDRATRRCGQCRFRDKTITLSRVIYGIEANRDHALNTILHEVAHVLAGPHAGHGPIWKAQALRLGIAPERCASDLPEVPKGRIVGTCTCGPRHHRHRVDPARSYSCKVCRTKITWERA